MRWITSAVVTFGVCGVAPVMAGPAMAGEEHGFVRADFDGPAIAVRVDRDEFREQEWREHHDVAVPEVPHRVIETAERVGNGRHIDSVVFVRTDRHEFFVVHMSRYHKQDISLRIEPDGDLISIDR